MKLSIVVPMYNVENYIQQCLDSLVAQTLTDFEILVVDDGSTDNGPMIVDQMIEKYPHLIKQLHKKNGGLSDARNYAIDYVQGEYIAFLDSDDYVEHSLYDKLVNKIEEGFDVVVTNIEYFYENGNPSWIMNGLTSWKCDTISKQAILSPMFAWNKIYKTSIFKEKGFRYPLNTWYEDIPVTTPIFATTDKIGYLNETLIHYRQREGSIMSVTKSERLKEIFDIMQMVREEMKKLNLYEEYRDEIEYLHIEHLRLYGMFRFIRSPLFSELYDMSEYCMKENFPNWKKNKYIKNLGSKNKMFLRCFSKETKGLFDLFIK
ncbi:MAG: glycosyltransferase [Anaerorhabdus sp.]|uniref:glycosyltransferase n=1 Tax=Anaerorhabdus sp. TaxID=1872524 RepID=UPI002FC604A2